MLRHDAQCEPQCDTKRNPSSVCIYWPYLLCLCVWMRVLFWHWVQLQWRCATRLRPASVSCPLVFLFDMLASTSFIANDGNDCAR